MSGDSRISSWCPIASHALTVRKPRVLLSASTILIGSKLSAYPQMEGDMTHGLIGNRKSEKTSHIPAPDRLKILWPTVATVGEADGVVSPNRICQRSRTAHSKLICRCMSKCGGSLFLNQKTWDDPKFPKGLFFDSKCKTGDMLMHTKVRVTFRKKQRWS